MISDRERIEFLEEIILLMTSLLAEPLIGKVCEPLDLGQNRQHARRRVIRLIAEMGERTEETEKTQQQRSDSNDTRRGA